MPAPSLSMELGVPLTPESLLFFASLAAATWLVYLFCRKKFDERSVTESSDYIYQLLPRQLATRQEYATGFLTYFGTMALMVLVFSLLGPKNLEPLGITLSKEVSYIGVPLAIAFVLMGALPNVPGLMLVEKYLRQFAHERAYIPDAARATAQRLAAADFDFTSYQGEALHSPEMRGVEPADFTRSRHTIEHGWARLCCLVYVLKSCRMDGLTEDIDASLLKDYENDLDRIESEKKRMEEAVAAYRTAKATDPYYSDNVLRRDIADNLYKLYILLGCAVRLRMQPNDDIDHALGRFGFKLNHVTHAEGTGDLQLVGLTAIAVTTVLLGMAAAGVGQLGLWSMSPVFPQTVFQPFVDAASTLVPHAIAMIAADLMRRHAIGRGSWFGTVGPHRRANSANYIRVALVCGVAGYAGLVLWGLAQQAPTADGFKIDIPNALLAMVTGGFYVYHLDNVEIGRRPSRSWELGAQTVATGLCGLIAACATWQFIFGAAAMAIDRIVLTTAINAAVGFALAWYIPTAAAASRCDPLAEASEERARDGGAGAAGRCRRSLARPITSRPREHVAAGGSGGRCRRVRARHRLPAGAAGTGRVTDVAGRVRQRARPKVDA